MVPGAEGSGSAEDAGAVGNVVVEARARTEDVGTLSSSVCTIGGGCSSVGRSTAGWLLISSRGGR